MIWNIAALIIGWAVMLFIAGYIWVEVVALLCRALRDTRIDWLNALDRGLSRWAFWRCGPAFINNIWHQANAAWHGYTIESVRRGK